MARNRFPHTERHMTTQHVLIYFVARCSTYNVTLFRNLSNPWPEGIDYVEEANAVWEWRAIRGGFQYNN